MPELFAKFLPDDGAATSLEYAFVLGLIAMALVVAFSVLGQSVEQTFDYVSSGVIDVMPAGR